MATMWFVLVSIFLPLVLSTSMRSSIFVQVPSPDGPLEIFGRSLPDRAIKVIHFGIESPIVTVTLSTDGENVLVKSEYDRRGSLIDCDIIDNRADVDRFLSHVDETIAKELERNKLPMPKYQLLHGRRLFDITGQMQECQRLLSKSQDSDREDDLVRKKRSYLIWPGTNWCGKGSKADFAESFGPNKAADQCCQKHDQCPYLIEGLSTRYNLFNYRIHTLSHCDCDTLFMNCLQAANTSTANMVGKVYFNVVNTECFELNLQKTCARRSWWGACEKYTTKWAASVKSLGNFPE